LKSEKMPGEDMANERFIGIKLLQYLFRSLAIHYNRL